jgi:hypothetical protein
MSLVSSLVSAAAAAITSPATLALLLSLFVLSYWWLTRHTGVMEKKGLRSETPSLLFGNMKVI